MQRETATTPMIISVMKFERPRLAMMIGKIQSMITKSDRIMPAVKVSMFSAAARPSGNSSRKMFDSVKVFS